MEFLECLRYKRPITQRMEATERMAIPFENTYRLDTYNGMVTRILCVIAVSLLHPTIFILRRRKLFITTDTLENTIAAEAMIGESNQPVQG